MTSRNEEFDKDETVAGVEERVQARFPTAPHEVVHDEAVAAVDKYADAPVKDFVEIIAERDARAAVAEVLDED
ncbi:three-helix bundle dimerization domain-containing protein [Microbacterium sp. NPDC090007]|uniref:three-helix bundle dimerization domain-containing protein n=1 Tax=Microbacterium sp. NPDC090007 TaxID=3364204 RepID=UPI0037FDA43E